jgi:hypothetical protein
VGSLSSSARFGNTGLSPETQLRSADFPGIKCRKRIPSPRCGTVRKGELESRLQPVNGPAASRRDPNALPIIPSCSPTRGEGEAGERIP